MTRLGLGLPTRLAAAVCAAAGLFAGSAQAMTAPSHPAASIAGSIAYQSGNNIWIAAPTGSGQRMVTRDGRAGAAYAYPTQADNGTIEAVRSYTTLYHLSRTGARIGRALKVATGTSNNFSLHTLALDAAISPNAAEVGATIVEYQGLYDPSTGGKSADLISEDVKFYGTSNGKVEGTDHLAGTYLMAPTWMNNNQLLVFAPYNISAPQVYVDSQPAGWGWFGDGDLLSRQPLNHGEMTRQKNKLAVIKGNNLANDWRGTVIQIYSVSGLKSTPSAVCSIPAQHGAFGKVTWSPDGTTLAWSDSNGIWVSQVQVGAANCGLTPRLIIRGGKNPDWGPAR